jgi:asparagine synthase (glutamine-hydrolysing)
MCGIAGIVSFNGANIDSSLLTSFAAPLKYRGPDQDGSFIDNNAQYQIGFAHKRLSIIDLSENGRQPMFSESKDVCIVFNGEIYNYKTLKERLKKHSFTSTSDTEVIIAAYKEWGFEKALTELDGMFAIALFDFKTQTLYFARDRFGEKPLYYLYENGLFAFSSDIRSFYTLKVNLSINRFALANYFAELCTPAEHSIWTEVKKLLPAHYGKLDKTTGLKTDCFWQLNYKNKLSVSESEIVENCETLIENSVKSKLVADVPVGCFLSGGIDSSLVALYAAKFANNLNTFSVGFNYEKFNELPYAKIVADKIGAKHHEVIIDPSSIAIVNELLGEYGEPFADSSQIPTYYISKFARQHVKVVIGGDGGDEVFAGYRTYNQGYRMMFWYHMRYLSSFLSPFSFNEKINYIRGVMNGNSTTIGSALYRNMGFSTDELFALTNDMSLSNAVANTNRNAIAEALQFTSNPFDALLFANVKTRMPNDYLVKTDRASMFASLELRTPFLDKNLIEYTAQIPYDLLMKRQTNKYITKTIAEKYFDKAFIYRQKMGFSIPIGEWIKREWKNEVEEVIFNENPFIKLNKEYIESIYNKHITSESDNTHKLWALYVFNKWAISVHK